MNVAHLATARPYLDDVRVRLRLGGAHRVVVVRAVHVQCV